MPMTQQTLPQLPHAVTPTHGQQTASPDLFAAPDTSPKPTKRRTTDAAPAHHHHTPAGLKKLVQDDPDLLDRIFDYLTSDAHLKQALQHLGPDGDNGAELIEKIKANVRREFGGETAYIPKKPRTTDGQVKMQQVLALFNGRNATEVARRLQITRRTVYRYIKQAKTP